MKPYSIWVITLLLVIPPICAQESWMDEETAGDYWTTLREEGPLNINAATREQLEALPFLSTKQVENILEYRFDYKRLYTREELFLIRGLDSTTAKTLYDLCEIGPTEDELTTPLRIKGGKHHLTLRSNVSLPIKQGYKDSTYLGIPLGGYLKYQYQHPRMQASLILEQDEGEPLNWKKGPGFDFYSGAVAIQPGGCVKNVILGDFKANYGQGVVWNTSTSFSKQAELYSLHSNATHLRPSFSTAESGYLRGAAVELGGKRWETGVWVSHTRSDKKGGYHRTLQEQAAKDTLQCQEIGAQVGMHGRYWQIGAQTQWKRLQSVQSWNTSIDFTCKIKGLYLSGEVALNDQAQLDVIGKMQYFTPTLSCYLQGRHQPSKNEVSAAIAWRIARRWKLDTYATTYHQPRPIGTTSRPVQGYDTKTTLQYQGRGNCQWQCIYQHYAREHTHKLNKKDTLYTSYKHQLRVQCTWDSEIGMKWVGGAIGTIVKGLEGTWQTGALCFIRMQYQSTRVPIRIASGLAAFQTSHYDARMYVYEADVWQAYSSIACYDRAIRMYGVISYHWKHISLYGKIGHTCYTDKTTIGTSASQTLGPSRTDIHILLRSVF